MIDRTDLGVIVTEGSVWGDFEEWLLAEFRERGVAAIAVFNKIDLIQPVKELIDRLTARGVTVVRTAAVTGYGILDLRRALLNAIPDELINQPELMGGTVGQDELIVLVVPIDRGAPKGRLILPQVQAIRDILDHDAQCLVVKDTGLRGALARLERPPDLVVTDSQVFAEVAREVPSESRLTSFSILFANWKGDLAELVRGTQAIDRLQPGDRILIAEACTHHPSADDIGRVKIPRWLAAHAGGELVCDHVQGHDFPQDVRPYRLIVHCGACMFNRREMLSRILHCRKFGVPITNYGLTIAYLLGVLRRALEPFPAARAALEEIDQCV
jgi:[FeFe] hydrogenase H-cluster maturation GTPase HydF